MLHHRGTFSRHHPKFHTRSLPLQVRTKAAAAALGDTYIEAQVLAQDGTGQPLQMRNAQCAQTNMTIDTNRQLHNTILDPYSLF